MEVKDPLLGESSSNKTKRNRVYCIFKRNIESPTNVFFFFLSERHFIISRAYIDGGYFLKCLPVVTLRYCTPKKGLLPKNYDGRKKRKKKKTASVKFANCNSFLGIEKHANKTGM